MLRLFGLRLGVVYIASIWAEPEIWDGKGGSVENKADVSINPLLFNSFCNLPSLIFSLVLMERITLKPS